MTRLLSGFALTGLIWGLMVSSVAAQPQVDEELPDYKRLSGISGNISSIGSDTLSNLMTLWAEEFKRNYPGVNIQIQSAGSATTPPAMSEGTSNLGPMSRLMKDSEIQDFEQTHGYKPTPVAVAIDALAIFVHKDNPIEGLTIEQVDGIFSSTLLCGSSSPITKWGQLGLEGDWRNRSIQLYGRNSVSGTYGHFKLHAMCKGDFKAEVNEQPGSASVVQAVSASLNGIGYSGMGYTTSSVRRLPLARESGKAFIEASRDNALNGTYPLARFLYIYINIPPNEAPDPLTQQFVHMALSKQGQEIVVKDGYVPLPAAVAERELKKILPPQPAEPAD
ncbi:MAG TPA: phosphate ABC transporter substrate-binding protein PstS family protein [Xanthomonadales bacterium]|nr:phosphate ABC transporter substrate-binding protein PstS family protein [Xanthomonadales bacterium]